MTLNNNDEESLHVPLLLDTLDLASWIFMFILATAYRIKTVVILKGVQTKLSELLFEDELDVVSIR